LTCTGRCSFIKERGVVVAKADWFLEDLKRAMLFEWGVVLIE